MSKLQAVNRAVALSWVAVLVVATGCSATPAAQPHKRPPPMVSVAAPTVRELPITLGYTVDVRPIEQADLQSKVAGYVEKITVDRGDPVRKGQLLAEVRPSDLPSQVSAAREQVGQSEAGLQLAEQQVRRARELFKREMISRAELDQAEAQLQIARAQRGNARSSLGAVSTRLAETRIVAPFSGWVAKRYLDPGALVQPGPQNATLLTVVRVDQVRVFVSVLEQQAALVKPGQAAAITVDALPGRSFAGVVSRVPPTLDVNTRTLEVEIVIPNGDGTLKPGMYGRASITVDRHPRAVLVPVEAVLFTDEATAAGADPSVKPRAVYVVKGGKAQRIPVETGFDGGDWIEIVKGLKGDEQVVVQGVDLVTDGGPVAVGKAAKPASPSTAATERANPKVD